MMLQDADVEAASKQIMQHIQASNGCSKPARVPNLPRLHTALCNALRWKHLYSQSTHRVAFRTLHEPRIATRSKLLLKF